MPPVKSRDIRQKAKKAVFRIWVNESRLHSLFQFVELFIKKSDKIYILNMKNKVQVHAR